MLERADILALVTYVRQVAGLEEVEAEVIEAGEALFAENCASCHGEDARGDSTLGAPNLTDEIWIYGGGRETVYRTLFGGREGHMPNWGDRLSPIQLRILALYVQSLGQP
jgi:cytochrome c oxidase cbb3-type subunit 3